jgi:hypothetical protein
LSVTAKVVMGTARVVEVAGRVKTLIVGAIVSGRVMTTLADTPVEIFPAASLAKALRVFVVATVCCMPLKV